MKNKKLIVFFVLLFIYAAGIFFGSIRQVKTENQEEMYAYLESGVAEYDVKFSESIKSVAIDNAKIFALLALCGIFRAGIFGICAVMALKGYTAGFALTAALRFFGAKGLFFATANLLSAAFVIPLLALFGAFSSYNLRIKKTNTKSFWKRYIVLTAAVLLILFADSIVRGTFSRIFIRLAAASLK